MNNTTSRPQSSSLLASSLPGSQPWRVYTICWFRVGGFLGATLFLIYLDAAIGSIPSGYFFLPTYWNRTILTFMACFTALFSALAFLQKRWSQQVMANSEPVPLDRSISYFLWWLSLFCITIKAGTIEEQVTLRPVVLEAGEVISDMLEAIQYIRFSFFNTYTTCIVGVNDRCIEIGRQLHERRAALLALLLIAGHEGIKRDRILQLLYKGEIPNKNGSFDHDRPRLFDDLNKLAQQWGFLPISSQEEIFDNKRKGVWYPGPLLKYDRALEHLLQSWKTRIDEARDRGTNLDRKILRDICLQAIDQYGEGFLAIPQSQDKDLWRWAEKCFLDYRRYFLVILEYAVELEITASEQEGENQEECLRYAALFLECAMLAILKVIPDRRGAERFKDNCLKQYKRLGDLQAIERVNTMFEMLKKQEEQRKQPGKMKQD